MIKPIIGILGNTYKTTPAKFSSSKREYVNSDYVEAVLNNGGMPIAVPSVSMLDDPESALSFCDGILVPGGEDVSPWYYGEEPSPGIQTIRPESDEAWMAAGRYALEKKIPMLGICKGIQFLNVLCGGTLYQDLYLQREGSILHMQSLERSYLFHHVDIRKDTYLAGILGEGKHAVNSMHHQAVRELGRNLTVSAVAPDGTVEAIESSDVQIVAVQWHPEGLIHTAPEMNKLFADLVRRSEAYHNR